MHELESTKNRQQKYVNDVCFAPF